MATANSTPYAFDNATEDAQTQVRLLAEILDQHTTSVLDRLIQPGWRCLDAGAGGGSITTWLAERIAPDGRVTAIDTDPRHVRPGPGITIVEDDIRTAPLPADSFDLVHARLLLMHLPTRAAVLARLVQTLRPGGLLMVSDWDCTHTQDMLVAAPTPAVQQAFTTFQQQLVAFAADRGASMSWARMVPAAMRGAGLEHIDGTVHNRLWAGGHAGCLLHASNSRQLQQVLLDRGMTVEQLQTLREAMADPSVLAWSYPMYTTVGRRPY